MRRLTVFIPEYQHKLIQELTKETGLTRSDLLRRILDEYFNLDPIKVARRRDADRRGEKGSQVAN